MENRTQVMCTQTGELSAAAEAFREGRPPNGDPCEDREEFSKLFDLTGRVAIVTGGTRGIGRAIAEGLVCAGAKVVVASRKADACAETEAHLTAMGGEALGVPTHMGDLDALQALVDTHRRALRRHRHRRQQRGQRADAAARRVHRRGVGQVVRREPARAGVPRPGRAART